MMQPPPPEEEEPRPMEDSGGVLHCPQSVQLAWRFCDEYLVQIGVEEHPLACGCDPEAACPLLTAELG